jgi:hypothetical protein
MRRIGLEGGSYEDTVLLPPRLRLYGHADSPTARRHGLLRQDGEVTMTG